MSKHTKGKWEITANGLNIKSIMQDKMIAYCDRLEMPIEEAEANASLIAEAPELLEALDGLMFWINSGSAPSINAIEQARQAIAKAKGEE